MSDGTMRLEPFDARCFDGRDDRNDDEEDVCGFENTPLT